MHNSWPGERSPHDFRIFSPPQQDKIHLYTGATKSVGNMSNLKHLLKHACKERCTEPLNFYIYSVSESEFVNIKNYQLTQSWFRKTQPLDRLNYMDTVLKIIPIVSVDLARRLRIASMIKSTVDLVRCCLSLNSSNQSFELLLRVAARSLLVRSVSV